MFDYLKEGFKEAFLGMEDDYRSIIYNYRKRIESLNEYVPEIAKQKAEAEEQKARTEIEKLKQFYWDKATKYLDDQAAALEKKSNRPDKIEDLIKNQMEMLLLEKELPFMDKASIEKVFENNAEPVRRLIMAHLRASDSPDSKYMINTLKSSEQDIINHLRGTIKQQQAYHNLVNTDAILTHNIDDDLRTDRTSPYFENNL
jgi:hypothetical protein